MRFIYFGKTKTDNNSNVISVGYKFIGDYMYMTFAFCNSTVDRFCKKDVHNILAERQQTGKYIKIQVTGRNPKYKEIANAAIQVLNKCLDNGKVATIEIPTWARKYVRKCSIV